MLANPSHTPRPNRDWAGRLAGAFLILWFVSLLWHLFQWGGPDNKALINDLLTIPVGLLAGGAALAAALDPAATPMMRRAWGLIALGYLGTFTGDLLWYYSEHWLQIEPFPSWADAGYLAFYPLLLAGLLCLRRIHVPSPERRTFLLDAGVVVVAGLMVVWYFVAARTITEGTDWLTTVLSLAYPVGDLVVLFGLVALTVSGRLSGARTSVRMLTMGIACYVVADILFAWAQLRGLYETGSWLDFLWMTADLAVAGSAWLYRKALISGGLPQQGQAAAREQVSLLPYSAVAVSSLLLLAGVIQDEHEHLPILVAGTILIMGLTSVRQYLALRENRQLAMQNARLVVGRTEARFHAMIKNASDVVTVVSPKGIIHLQSPAVARVFGYAPDELKGTDVRKLIHPDDRHQALTAVSGRQGGQVECRVRHRDGSWRWAETTISNLIREPGVRGLILNSRDVTERKGLEERLRHLAYHDPLTELANRELFRRQVARALAVAKAESPVSVLFLDLDGFKRINDSLGHHVGDQLLKRLAERLFRAVATDGLVARLGGDEFAVLAMGGTSPAGLAQRIVEAVRPPFGLGSRQVHTRISIGIAEGRAGESVDDLLRNADTAMYVAKSAGGDGYAAYSPDMHAAAIGRVDLEADLRRAVAARELMVHYQPLVDMKTGQIASVEALLRWSHSERGSVPPDEFIPLAEETGLMHEITLQVLWEACSTVKGWQTASDRHAGLSLAVNLSAVDLRHPEIIGDIKAVLDATGLAPGSLTLEITESLLVERTETMSRRLRDLRDLGVLLAIDDFGTGYSSFSYLKDFPVDIIKIDKSFVQEISRSTPECAMVRGILQITRALGLQSVAEGVEEQAQVDELRRMSCDHAQGYFFARPVSAAQIADLLGIPGAPARVSGGRSHRG